MSGWRSRGLAVTGRAPPQRHADRRPRGDVLIQSLQGVVGAWRGDGRRWQVGERQTCLPADCRWPSLETAAVRPRTVKETQTAPLNEARWKVMLFAAEEGCTVYNCTGQVFTRVGRR